MRRLPALLFLLAATADAAPDSVPAAPPSQAPPSVAPPSTPRPAAPCVPASAPPPAAKAPREKSVFEFSLASAHAFPIEHIGKYDDNVDIVPPSSLLLLVEYFFNQAWRARFFYDLALTTDKRITDGAVSERVIPSALGLGLTWVPLRFAFLENSQVEFQGTIWGAMIIEEPIEYFPMWTGRIHLMKDSTEGVGVYLGIKWELIRDTLGPFYGVGYRF